MNEQTHSSDSGFDDAYVDRVVNVEMGCSQQLCRDKQRRSQVLSFQLHHGLCWVMLLKSCPSLTIELRVRVGWGELMQASLWETQDFTNTEFPSAWPNLSWKCTAICNFSTQSPSPSLLPLMANLHFHLKDLLDFSCPSSRKSLANPMLPFYF